MAQFGTFISTALRSTFDTEDSKRRKSALGMFQIYNGYHDETASLVEQKLRAISNNSSFDIKKKPYVPMNITKRLVQILAMVYKKAAIRTVTPEGSEKPDSAFEEIVKDSTYNRVSKQWDKYANLYNTVLVRPIWAEDENHRNGGKLDFLIHTPNSTTVVWEKGNYLKAAEVYEYVSELQEDGSYQEVVYFWSDTEHYMMAEGSSDKLPVGNNAEMVNHYGVVPHTVLRIDDVGEFWGDGMRDLTEAQLVISSLATMLNETGIMQGFEEVFLVNLVSEKSGLGSDGSKNKFESGPGKRHVVSGIDKDDAKSEVITYTPELMLEELIKQVDWLARTISWRYGLDGTRVATLLSGQKIETSGVAKSIDNGDLEEIRTDRLEAYRDFEDELFRNVRRVIETETDKTIIDGEFRVDFGETEIKRTEKEVREQRTFEIETNAKTTVDHIMEDNPDLDRKAAEAQWRINMKINQEAEGFGTAVPQTL